jgi:hypothetical protein
MLLSATATQTGDPYSDLEELYGAVLGQWRREMGHVVNVVGGVNSQQKHVGQNGVLFTPVPKARQVEAVKFLNAQVFATPAWMLNPEILRRIEPNGALDRIKGAQQGVLTTLLNSARFGRLIEQEALGGDTAYRPVDFLADVRRGIWGEIYGTGTVKTDAYRRNLQRAYLNLLDDKLNGRAAVSDDQRPFLRGELRTLNGDVTKALARTTDRATRMHLEDVRDEIARILDPKFAPPAPAAPTVGGAFGRGLEEEEYDYTQERRTGMAYCWPDYTRRLPRQ